MRALLPLLLGASCILAHAYRYQRKTFTPRVEALLANLTVQQQIGQMSQINIDKIIADGTNFTINKTAVAYYISNFFVGSFLNVPVNSPDVATWDQMMSDIQEVASSQGSKIPIIYGLDSVHGANYVYGAALFPQSLSVAATFNRSAAYLMAATSAKDTRAAQIPWAFAPILGLMSNPIWPRCYETLGEDPYLASEMATQLICGAQGCPRTLSDPTKVAATAKHFFGYPNPRSGQDRTPAWIPFRHLLNYYKPAFQAAFDAGVATTMESYSEVDGVPMASSALYLKTLLRDVMGFDGFLVTDFAEIENLYTWHHVAASPSDAVFLAINRTTIDMSMIPEDTSFATDLFALVASGAIPAARIAESAGRVLAIKEELGLLDAWVDGRRITPAVDPSVVGTPADRANALNVAREAIVLVKNDDNTLPFTGAQAKHGVALHILLVGPSADSIGYQSGGWSIHWQGADDNEFAYGTTVLAALTQLTSDASILAANVTYVPVCDIDGNINSTQLASLQSLGASWADVIVFLGGETHYAEKPGNIQDLTLPAGQLSVMDSVNSFGLPTVLVLFEGRPRLLAGRDAAFSAIFAALLPGPDAGIAVSELLLGVTSPSGRMPFSYASQPGNTLLHYWHSNPEADTFDPLWSFGTGLSYTNFTYSSLTANVTQVTVEQLQLQPVGISVTVTNAGLVASAVSVLLYLTDEYRTVTPEVKMLKGFDKVFLAPNEATTLTFTLGIDAFSFYNEAEPPVWTIEPGTFIVSLQDSDNTANILVLA